MGSPNTAYKLEAGCRVRHKRAPMHPYHFKGEREVVFVSGYSCFLEMGDLADRYAKVDLEVTEPATPEVNDYVLIHQPGGTFTGIITDAKLTPEEFEEAKEAFGTSDVGQYAVTFATGETRLYRHRNRITIIAKARHARESIEGK